MGVANSQVPASVVERGSVVRQEIGSSEIARTAETASTAVAAHATAMVKAMYSMAIQQPRSIIRVREKLLDDCKRKAFAEVARYKLPRGGKTISGPSVRFAEAAARALGNMHRKTTILYEDDMRRAGEVMVIDLESNLIFTAGFSIEKTIERRQVKPGDHVLHERVNSTGEVVYLIPATEADIQAKQENLVSRIRRNLVLELLPGDIKDEALAQCTETLRTSDAADPKAAAKKLSDAFRNDLGIAAAQIQAYLGHPVDTVTPDEAEDLRGIYSAIADKETTWAEVLEAKSAGVSATTDERRERVKLQQLLGAARVKDAKAYEAAMAAAGVKGKQSAAQLPIETLRKIAVALGLVEPGPTAAADGSAKPTMSDWADSQGRAPQAVPDQES